jgi:hypothetical protein
MEIEMEERKKKGGRNGKKLSGSFERPVEAGRTVSRDQ